MSRLDASGAGVIGGGAPAAAPSSGLDKVVALALAAMAAVLAMVFVDLKRSPSRPPEANFDFVNPMLSAQPGQCVEISTEGVVGGADRLVVRPAGVVLRAHSAAAIPDWLSPVWTNPREFPAYLLCERVPASGPPPAGTPPPKAEALVFPLNGFGMDLENVVVLRGIQPATISWNGRTHEGFMVFLDGYGGTEGPWTIYVSKDAPVLGVMRRDFFPVGARESMRHSVRVPDSCR